MSSSPGVLHRRGINFAATLIARNNTCTQSLLFSPFRGIYIPVDPSSRSTKLKPRRKNEKKRSPSGRPSYRFVDRTRVRAQGGMGGKGSLSMHHLGRKHNRRPDGGHGGRGGDVVVVADPNEQTLRWTHPHIKADAGQHGSSQERHGRKGQTKILRVPCGVVVRRILNYDEVWDDENQTVMNISADSDLNEMDSADYEMSQYQQASSEYELGIGNNVSKNNAIEKRMDDDEEALDSVGVLYGSSSPRVYTLEGTDNNTTADENDESIPLSNGDHIVGEREKVVLADLDTPGAHVFVARGGRGGRGNCTYARKSGPLPAGHALTTRATPKDGEVAFLELELKLIADVGLVGFPNAGKSSLLAAMSRATPKIAPYPFTTLHPLIGCVEYRDGFRLFAADVPGLVGGASEGKGRGRDFLRHLERTKSFLYIVDAAGVDGRNPVQDLQTLADEVSSYGDGDMMNKPSVVVANKVDLIDQSERESLLYQIRAAAVEAGIQFDGQVCEISAGVTGYGLGALSEAMRNVVRRGDCEGFSENKQAY